MGGQASLRGYLVQTIIAILESLDKDTWESVCIEPNDEHEKVDIKWSCKDETKFVYQVKSSQNPFSFSEAKKWSQELKSSTTDAKSYTLFLVGRLSDNLYNKLHTFDVEILHKDLNLDTLMAEMFVLIEKFYSQRGKGKITFEVREILTNSLITEFFKGSIIGKVIDRNEFDTLLLKQIGDIEKMASQNPFAQFMPTQSQQKAEEKSHDVAQNILKLIGWNNLEEPQPIVEIDEETGEEIQYKVDFSQRWESKLKDNVDDNIFVSAIVDGYYPTNAKKQWQEHLINFNKHIERYRNKGVISTKEQSIFNILFWLSLDNQDVNKDYNDILKTHIKTNELDNNASYLIMDNARTNFLISSIVTAKNFNNLPVKFLYPITEENLTPKKIGKRGYRLPPQYINSSILPIVKESDDKISILLFCNDSFSSDNLKKVIWLIVKLTSGFGNEYIVYFPDYNDNFKNEVNSVISSFNDELLFRKTSVKSMSVINYTDIGNLPQIEIVTIKDDIYNEENEKVSVYINEAFIEQLPYGDMLKPFLKTDLINSGDLKLFLSHRGIFFKNSDKTKITPLLTTLLFTPSELQNFIRFINKTEHPAPTVPVIFPTVTNISIPEIFKTYRPNFSKVNEGINSRLLDQVEFKPDKRNSDIFTFESYVEVKDPTKQITVNTQAYPIKITCERQGDAMILTNMETNCRDGKTIGKRIIKEVERTLRENNVIKNEAIKIMFDSFKDNVDRVNFLLSFTRLDDSILLIDQDIKSVKYNFDKEQEIPELYKDKNDKDILFILRGKQLSGISEMSEMDFKKAIHLEEIEINYKYNYRGTTIGYYTVTYNFSNALKNKAEINGEFRTVPYLHNTYSLRKNIKDSKPLEYELRKEIEKMKLSRFKQFNLI